MTEPGALALPTWAIVTDRRRAHIARVAALVDDWARAMGVSVEERDAWRDGALWHDALRDAPEEVVRGLAADHNSDSRLLHGPAAAARLEQDGEARRSVLDAVRWHTVGAPDWDRTGRALYMADFLEPGREFARADRAYLARQVPHDFDGTFRQVVRTRMARAIEEGKGILPQTLALWNSVR